MRRKGRNEGRTNSLVELGASIFAYVFELLFGIGRVAGELALDFGSCSIGVAFICLSSVK